MYHCIFNPLILLLGPELFLLFQVVFVTRLAAFSTLPFQQFHYEQSHDIYFGDAQIHTQFR